MNRLLICVIVLWSAMTMLCGQHPSLNMTKADVREIRASLGNVPVFDNQLALMKAEVDKAIESGIDVPIPKDMAGGYSHEVHKLNYKLMQKAGNLYQITGETQYADYVKSMLMEYVELYPTLGLHPTMKSYATGKIFWQCLNDANWLVFTSQAYDSIYDYLSKGERLRLENDLFIPYCNFLSVENPKFFNRIHNHSTWANAAVGMMALAMDNDTLLEKALYGLKDDGIALNEVDNDGGFIKSSKETKAGFFAQLDYAFAPSGYFSEGPYYERYAIFPFLVFSYALNNKQPELDIFNYRDGILRTATNSVLQLTNAQGQFFPINDAQKGMSFHAFELVNAVDIIYSIDPDNQQLLDWAVLQDEVILNGAGFDVAQALMDHTPRLPQKVSQNFSDGVDGNQGGVTVMRNGNLEVIFKYSTQGMGHGHFDRLSYGLYDETGEVVQDYGAVRWVNVDQKGGGRYLPENKTFGKKTVGHNALVVNQTSHFDSNVKSADEMYPSYYHSDFADQMVHMVSATEVNAYPDTEMQRSLFLINPDDNESTLLLDIMHATTANINDYDLPLWYTGEYLKGTINCPKSLTSLTPLGVDDGYQHIWKESICNFKEHNFQFNWMGNGRFYSGTLVGSPGDQLVFGRAGANDPEYNLRPDPVIIHRRDNTQSTTFISMIESHGTYDRSTEIPLRLYPTYHALSLDYEDDEYIMCSFQSAEYRWELLYSMADNKDNSTHTINFDDSTYSWKGVYQLTKTKK